MSQATVHPRSRLRTRPVMAGLLLALFAFVLAMAHFKTLHALCHAEAEQPGHHCVVTLVTQGQVDVAASEIVVALPPSLIVAEVRVPASFVRSVDAFLLPSRGPPAFLG